MVVLKRSRKEDPDIKRLKSELRKLKTIYRLIEHRKKKVKKIVKSAEIVYTGPNGENVEKLLKKAIKEGEALLLTLMLSKDKDVKAEIAGDTVFITDESAEHFAAEIDKVRRYFEALREKMGKGGEGGE